jgi:hypothetical protein
VISKIVPEKLGVYLAGCGFGIDFDLKVGMCFAGCKVRAGKSVEWLLQGVYFKSSGMVVARVDYGN